jgi:hypothetical protein
VRAVPPTAATRSASPVRPEPGAATRPAARPAARVPSEPVPLLAETRRFLRPLVGIDPDTVRVHRGVATDAVVEARGAEAITVGDDILLPVRHDERAPEARGLIAHELTHVARRREPVFVPPVSRVPGPGGPVADDTSDEEAVARGVEASVRDVARVAAQRDASPRSDAPQLPAGPTSGMPVRPRRPWGNLPAPWEPIPGLDDGAGATATGPASPAVARGGIAAAGAAPMSSLSAPVNSSNGGAVAEVQHADVGRPIAEAMPDPAPTGAHGPQGAPRPDVDLLARQVYDVLKRRIAAERRRGA